MSDLISRQDAVNALDKRFDDVPMELTTEILLLRKDLREVIPSAQPETISDTADYLKLQNSNDTISRQAAIDALCAECTVDNPKTCSTIQEGDRWCDEVYILLNLPSAQSETHDKRTETHVCDLISRQWLMECVNEGWIKFETEKDKNKFIHLIRDTAPSAQPDLDEWCNTCREYDHERHCCPRFNRVIREALKEAQPEVIHCRDCRYENMGECEHKFGLLVANEENYCSYAERREE